MMKKDSGYIALMSAIIISIVLITVVSSVSVSGFFGRFNILDSEYKEISSGLAEACVEIAIIKLANDNSYVGGEVFPVGAENCEIVSITLNPPDYTVKTQGIYNNAYTNLEVKLSNSGDFAITLWKEVSSH
jgi:hypothetical protein